MFDSNEVPSPPCFRIRRATSLVMSCSVIPTRSQGTISASTPSTMRLVSRMTTSSASLLTERIGLYPGTFDPVTLGHADIIRRGAKLVDRLIIGVTTNPSKDPMFMPDERIEMVRAEVARQGLANVEVRGFDALLMKFAESVDASVIIRGLRAVADFA